MKRAKTLFRKMLFDAPVFAANYIVVARCGSGRRRIPQ